MQYVTKDVKTHTKCLQTLKGAWRSKEDVGSTNYVQPFPVLYMTIQQFLPSRMISFVPATISTLRISFSNTTNIHVSVDHVMEITGLVFPVGQVR